MSTSDAAEYFNVLESEFLDRIRDALRLSDDEMNAEHPNLKDGKAMLKRAVYQFQLFARSKEL